MYLIDLFQREYAAATVKRRPRVIEFWRTSIDLTIRDEVERPQKRRHTVRYLPYWRKMKAEELDALSRAIDEALAQPE